MLKIKIIREKEISLLWYYLYKKKKKENNYQKRI